MYAGSQKPGWAPSGLSIVNEENHPKTRKNQNSINEENRPKTGKDENSINEENHKKQEKSMSTFC